MLVELAIIPIKDTSIILRGYKASRIAKDKATALIRYEGPMGYDESVEREISLYQELKMQGIDAYGGH